MSGSYSLIVFLISFVKWAGGEPFRNDLYTATADIESLTKTHSYVIERVQNYMEREHYRLEVLKKHLNRFKKEHGNMAREKTYALNPINAFTLILSLTEELQSIEHYLMSNNGAEILQRPVDMRFPLPEDLDGAAAALWRLQLMYNLNITSLAAGKLQGTFSSGNQLYEELTSPMSVSALFEVGRVVYNLADYESALQWFHEALKKYERRDPEDSYLHDDTYIIDYIRNAYHGIQDYKNAIEWTEKLMKLMPQRVDLHDSMVFYYNELAKNATESDTYVPVHPLESQDAKAVTGDIQEDVKHNYYPRLCRGEVAMAEEKKKSLHCSYKKGPNSFLQLAPIKTELIHHEPDVYLFYDTISDAEIASIRQITEPVLVRAKVDSEDNEQVSPARISKLAWLEDVDSPEVARVSQRVADFADLNMESAEPLQVSNYGLGGHYQPHYDFFNKTFEQSPHAFIYKYGNRLATIMFYMSEVEQGGATVFTEFLLTVFPVKNAAIMWTNLLPSGQPDFRTRHAACPVLRGSKWVSNIWVHELGQEFHKPCSLEYQENSYIAMRLGVM